MFFATVSVTSLFSVVYNQPHFCRKIKKYRAKLYENKGKPSEELSKMPARTEPPVQNDIGGQGDKISTQSSNNNAANLQENGPPRPKQPMAMGKMQGENEFSDLGIFHLLSSIETRHNLDFVCYRIGGEKRATLNIEDPGLTFENLPPISVVDVQMRGELWNRRVIGRFSPWIDCDR